MYDRLVKILGLLTQIAILLATITIIYASLVRL